MRKYRVQEQVVRSRRGGPHRHWVGVEAFEETDDLEAMAIALRIGKRRGRTVRLLGDDDEIVGTFTYRR